jgi:hypothetical protein
MNFTEAEKLILKDALHEFAARRGAYGFIPTAVDEYVRGRYAWMGESMQDDKIDQVTARVATARSLLAMLVKEEE